MTTTEPADLQRWSDEVARNPRSLAFLPLARAYRRRGLRDAAYQLCVRGLESHPANVEAHGLLALLHLERGERQKAADEWSIVLRVDPDNFEALRGLGFCYLEADQVAKASQMLERAAALRPADPAVQGALELLRGQQDRERPADPSLRDDPWAQEAWSETGAGGQDGDVDPAGGPPPGHGDASPAGMASPREARGTSARDGADGRAQAQPTAGAPGKARERGRALVPAGVLADPTQLFDELLQPGPLLGVLLIDGQGLVHAGRLTEAVSGDAVVLGAVLGGAIGEAARTAAHLSLGAWRGMQLEAEHALLHLAPAGGDAVVLLAARRTAPAGWILRTATHAVDLAGGYLEAYA